MNISRWLLTVWLMLTSLFFAQEGVKLQGEPLELLSSENELLSGVLASPRFAPPPLQVISFIRQSEGSQFLYVYDISKKKLTAIQPEVAAQEVTFPDTTERKGTYCGELDWRRQPDGKGRYWFAFVCQTEEGSEDIFLGYTGIKEYLRLTTHAQKDYQPRWSPDGKSLAFVSTRSGNGDIYLLTNMDKIIASLDVTRGELVQLTTTAGEERDLAWNPNPKSYLLAYARRVHYPGRPLATFQIEVLDVKRRGKYIYPVTDDPLTHYTRPMWEPRSGGKLLYVGQSIIRELKPVLYLSELMWTKMRQLKNKVLEGYKSVVFKNVRLEYTPAIWLSGGKGILCQEDRPEQNYPLYAINIPKWLHQQEGAVEYFEELHSRFPFILDYDVRKHNFVFSSREGEYTKIYIVQIYGEDIAPYEKPQYVLNHPGTGRFFTSTYFLTGGAVAAAGAITYFLLQRDGEKITRQPVPIGRPPSMP